MNQYEMLYLIDSSLNEEAKNAVVAKMEGVVTSMNGVVDSTEQWGLKKLAYPINYKNDAYYVLMNFRAEAPVVAELVRVTGISAEVVRQLITKKN